MFGHHQALEQSFMSSTEQSFMSSSPRCLVIIREEESFNKRQREEKKIQAGKARGDEKRSNRRIREEKKIQIGAA